MKEMSSRGLSKTIDRLSCAGEAATEYERHRSFFTDAFRRLLRHRMAMVSLVILGLLVFAALAAPWVSPHDPLEMHPGEILQGPSREYPMGTDDMGRDLLSRVIYGSRISLSVGIISVGISLVVGTILGLVSGYQLGAADTLISRIMDLIYAYPPILLVMVVVAMLGTGIDQAMIAIGIVFTPPFARICRGSVLAEREKLYVEAARTIGAGNLRILMRHILPNVMAPLIVQTSLCMSYAILVEAELSFLGLGTQPPNPSWGVMINQGRGLMHHSPWFSIWPGLAIMAVVFAFNVFGDGLRDALDPWLKRD
ncbi:MAG: ABC transporter permease [Anaerolineales bacterium]|nr:ABC transporter permease [Anaerolineales bacterium]